MLQMFRLHCARNHWGIRGLPIMFKKLVSMAVGLSLAVAVVAAGVQWVDGAPDRYTVQKGDTLWSISARFLQKPWQWPEVWQLNQQVRNPHLIYPGDELVLTGGTVRHGSGSMQPHIRVTDLDTAVPAVPLSDIKQFLKNARVVAEEDFEHAPHVVAIEENHILGQPGQLVYVRGGDIQPGQQYALARGVGRYYDMPSKKGRNPVRRHDIDVNRDGRPGLLWHYGPRVVNSDGQRPFLGYELLDFGIVEVTRSGDPASALVTYSDFEVKAGDLLLPIMAEPYDDQFLPHAPANMPGEMHVLGFTNALHAIGPNQVVSLSRGAVDGVENGQTYSIYRYGETVTDHTEYPRQSRRAFFNRKESQVTLPPEFIGHLMIFRTFDKVSYGLVMDAVRPVGLGDFLHHPDETP